MISRGQLALDGALLAAVLLVFVTLNGGLYAEPFGLRVSIRFERPLVLAGLLAVIRWFVYRRAPLLGIPLSRYFRRDADPPLASGARRWWHSALAVAGLAGFAVFFLRAQLQNMMGVPDFGDPLFSIWRVGWIFEQLKGDPRPLFDANIFHPTPLTLTFSDPILLIGLMGAPLRAAGLLPVVVNSTLMIGAFLLSAVAAYFLAVRLTGSALAGFVAGLLYGFHPYRFEHYGHLEQVSTYWTPLALLALLRFTERWQLRWALAAAACMVAQLYTAMQIGVYFPIYAVAVIGTILLVRARPPWMRIARPIAIAAAAGLAASIPLARPFMAAQAIKGERSIETVRYYSADLPDYLRAHDRSATYYGILPHAHDRPERALFPGATAIVLATAGLVPPLGPVRLALGVGLLFAMDLSRGTNGFTYPVLYDTLPPIRGMRVPARFAIIVGLSLVALAAYGAARLIRRVPGRAGRAVTWVGVIAFAAFELRPALDLKTVWAEPPRIYEHIRDVPDVVLAEFPPDPVNMKEVVYQYFSNWHWKQMINGYSGFILSEYSLMQLDIRAFPADDAIAVLRARGVTHVTVNCHFYGDSCPDVLVQVDKQPALELINISHWMGKPTRIYRLN